MSPELSAALCCRSSSAGSAASCQAGSLNSGRTDGLETRLTLGWAGHGHAALHGLREPEGRRPTIQPEEPVVLVELVGNRRRRCPQKSRDNELAQRENCSTSRTDTKNSGKVQPKRVARTRHTLWALRVKGQRAILRAMLQPPRVPQNLRRAQTSCPRTSGNTLTDSTASSQFKPSFSLSVMRKPFGENYAKFKMACECAARHSWKPICSCGLV